MIKTLINPEYYIRARAEVFKARCNLSFLNKVLTALLLAVITGIAAQIRLHIPFTPVPVTGQTFAVLIAGVLLGAKWGSVSQLFYVALGAAGVPWFTGFTGGAGILFGATGGYLIGFIIAAAFIGYISDNFARLRNFIPMTLFLFLSNFILIYVPGLLGLSLWMRAAGMSVSLNGLLLAGFYPFIIGDIFKIAFAAAVIKLITPKTDFKKD